MPTPEQVGPLVVRALESGAPWWLVLEAVASVRLDDDDDYGTHSLDG